MLASASDAIVIGFSVQADGAARNLAESEGVSIRQYDIIYRMIEDIEKALKGMLAPVEKITLTGHAEVRQVFHISKVGNVAGCRVLDGELHRNAKVRVMRAGEVVHESEISSLKHGQEDVKEVRQGFECGISVRGFDSFNPGDVLECYTVEMVAAA
jgi:translation initiation factor IF-2